MKYTKLPHTDISVSKICLGTMTWGQQNNEEEGHQQMDYAVDQGINFFDTAELYPVPARAETQGETERIIGSWFKKTGKRKDIILASKIAGPAPMTKHIRTGGFKREELFDAVDKSLQRMQTDYIDLYQLHWPERNTNYFGQRGYVHDPEESWNDNFRSVLESLQELVKAGKIRHVGLSNENPWGVMRFLEESRNHDLPRMITIQNPYNLLNRLFETGNAEVAMRENIGLLAYSPLGFGTLSGKYLGGRMPEGSRIKLFPNYNRYSKPQGVAATERYDKLAREHGLSLTHLALAFVNQQPFMTSNIIGATSMEQLKENIASIDIELDPEILKEISVIHNEIPNPAP
ncbi:NADP(H)-dependent aldo-keto reductase [Robertkochia aurantiaca]|uniref:NADP(H)-dependent aldo-keto reductase n=1 Tax=Robertkochia aurantiaca TaxID=2873700 RepID=UPI001CC9A357|nr:NADP(H)-dependent aldo-keto reductase [Robertkochia sp. 3YJGBD-33]